MGEDTNEEPGYDRYEDRETVPVYFDTRNNKPLKFTATEHHKEELTKAAEELGLPRSAAIRHWIEIGRRSMIANDPRNTPTKESSEENPIKDLIPEGRENALDIRDELPKKIEDSLLDIVDNDEDIKRDGFEVYL